ILGQLHSGRDLDKFVLQVDQASTLLIDLDYTATFSDIFLEVRDSAGTLLGVHTGPADGSASDTWMLGVTSPGDYTFTIRPEPYWVDFGASPAYRLAVDAVPSRELFESEGNDTSATADVLQLGGRIKGALSSEADADHYQVTLAASGMLAIDFDAPTNSLNTPHFQITLRDSLGATLLHRFTGTDAALRTGVLAAGTYDIAVAVGEITFSGETYSLQVNRRETVSPPSGALLGSEAGELLQGSEVGDSVYGRGGDDRISGGAGADTLVFESSLLNLDIASAAGLTAVRGNFAAGVHAYSVSRIWQVETLRTDDSLIALPTSAQVPLIGTRIDDVLVGTPGDDLLDGWGGNDLINGQGGNDTLALLGLRGAFALMTVGPVTRIQGTSQEYAGTTIKAWNVEALAFDQAQTVTLAGTGGAVIFGVAGDDRWTGTADDETFDGQGGNDTVDGGAGSDSVLFFDRVDNFTISYPGAGSSAVTVTGKPGSAYAGQTLLARHVETLRFADGAIEVANPPGLVLRSSNSALDEGGPAATLQVSLAAAPGQPVTLTLSAGLQLSTDAGQLHFDARNWATPQFVQVRAIDDTAHEADQTGVLHLAITTSDPLYATVDDVALPYRISDNGNDNATTGGVRGRLWHDFDKDSVIDASEVGLQGWTVFDDTNRNGVPDGDEPRTVSDALGQYLLGGLAPGVHTLVAVPETGWLPSAQAAGGSRATAIAYTAADGEVQLEGPIVGPQGGAGTLADYANLGLATRIADFHADPRFARIDGRGSAVVLIDTGIDRDHPSFGADANHDGTADRIVFQYDFTGANGPDASDTRGHGTHVAGIVGSSDPAYPGIAPGVNLIMLKVFSSDRSRGASTADLIEAANWVVEHAAEYNIVAVNMSLGAGSYADAYNGYLSTQLQALANLGVVAVASSGNRYPSIEQQGVGYPSADPNALSVGAVWAGPGVWPLRGQVGTTDVIAFFSQRDDTQSDIFAPGVFITSAEAGGSQVAYSGTSMAAPQISGMVALAQQLARETLGRSLSFDEIRDLLSSTGAPILDGDNENDTVANTGLTFRRADMLALAEAILALQPQASRSVEVLAGVNAVDQDFGFAATASPAVLDVDDIIVGAYWGDVLRGGGGNDRMQGAAGNDRMRGDAGDDDLDGGPDHDYLQGDAGRDTLRGGTGIDTLEGGDGDDLYYVDNPFDEVRESNPDRPLGGLDTVRSEVDQSLGDHLEVLFLDGPRARNGTGNALDNLLTGNTLDNQLRGGAGADTLRGGDGKDTLEGGAGRDSLVGGGGFDIADYRQATAGVSAELWRQFALNDGQGGQDVLLEIEGLWGSSHADLLAGAAGAESLQGGDGADGLYAAGGDDTLAGDAGADTMDGGTGSDLADYSLAPAGIRVELWRSLAPQDGHGAQDALWNIERVLGSGWNDVLVGGGAGDSLAGGPGDDTLAGAAGNDTLHGGTGSDLVDYSGAPGPVSAELWRQLATQDGQGGTDLLIGVERLTGSAFNDLLAGDNAAGALTGGAGDDGLYAAGGNDTLVGGAGNDTLDGGADWDTADYSAASGPVVAELWRALATADGTGGRDALWNIEGLIGTAFNDLLAGGNGDDGLSGADGNDTLAGRGGNDTLDGGGGRDIADYASASGPVTAELWRGWALQDGAGGRDLLRDLEGLSGSPWADLLAGAAHDESFFGGAGNDGIYAAGGNDTLAGGSGHDTLDGGPGVDTVDYSNATGSVTAELWRAYALNDGQGGQDALWNIESLIGSAQADLLAGAANNESFIGGAGNDGIYAAAGNDTLSGGAGADTLDGGAGTDLADYGAATGGVTAELWRAFALNDGSGGTDALWNIENLSGSAQADLLAGTNADNRLSGQGGADQIYAASGNDTLAGGLGADTLNGGAGADIFVFDTAPGPGNIDILQDFNPVDDTLQLAGSQFTALAMPGALVAGVLRSAAGATTAGNANDRLIYNSSTGALYYDADGSGALPAVQFAILGTGLALSVADFTMA
ncbi:MAG: S8 family serine peptidase, partial [Rhodoferax sp.]|nr:S8 family serine peptidase [Rhodoferax sp.]